MCVLNQISTFLYIIQIKSSVSRQKSRKMKVVIVLVALVSLALAAPPQHNSKDAVILKYESDNIGIDGYRFAYETSDGISRSEQAELKNAGTENEALVVRGTISWFGADGQQYTINFIADEDGYRPEGAHLPK